MVNAAPNRQLIGKALAQLPAEQLAVVRRSYYEAWTRAQIADDLYIAEDTVRSRRHDALRSLLLTLQKRGETVTNLRSPYEGLDARDRSTAPAAGRRRLLRPDTSRAMSEPRMCGADRDCADVGTTTIMPTSALCRPRRDRACGARNPA